MLRQSERVVPTLQRPKCLMLSAEIGNVWPDIPLHKAFGKITSWKPRLKEVNEKDRKCRHE